MTTTIDPAWARALSWWTDDLSSEALADLVNAGELAPTPASSPTAAAAAITAAAIAEFEGPRRVR